ncbi:DNA ligase [compost metagenome]
MHIGSVHDVEFETTQHGNVIPVLKIHSGRTKVDWVLPNIHVLQELKLWMGDIVSMTERAGKRTIKVLHEHRPIDASPVELPHVCQSCGEELHIYLERRLIVKCVNQSGCKAQNVG